MTYLEALQAVMAAEHAAVYAYGVVGARLNGTPYEGAAAAGYNAHRARRAAISLLVTRAGAQPTPAAVAYQLGSPVTTSTQARALAAQVERRLEAVYVQLVGAAPADARRAPAAWLADAAVRTAAWSGHVDDFPGLDTSTS
ncbi:MAG TPA: ferritin-like domain-containing protein [Actinomycetes bacterium]